MLLPRSRDALDIDYSLNKLRQELQIAQATMDDQDLCDALSDSITELEVALGI